jgi:malonyl-CoA/methylmalonyl-CoA synthetase
MSSTTTLVERARMWPARVAVVAPEGVFTYGDLDRASAAAAARVCEGRADLAGARVAFLVPPGWGYVGTLLGIWRAGGVAVPLAVSHPPAELDYAIRDTEPVLAVVDPRLRGKISDVARERGLSTLAPADLGIFDGAMRDAASPTSPNGPATAGRRDEGPATAARRDEDAPAMLLYTSGTTGRPKGVVVTHANIRAQVDSMVAAWGWTPGDHLLLHLPLHHIHGIVNGLVCGLWSGACVQILDRFEPNEVWDRLARGDVTIYMAVPTVYHRLIQAWEVAAQDERERWSDGARRLRLMISGSAALPVSTLNRWEEITGQRLLERYGMTEIGMALSNPLAGERRAGSVGAPLPGVDVRLVDENDGAVGAGDSGEIQVRGPTVFREYWRRPDETSDAFAPGGWFRTGDHAVLEAGAYRILGRGSVDILKTGGEKVSALEIEDVLREVFGVRDCAVVGVPDADWGERVCAAVVVGDGSGGAPNEAHLRAHAKERLAPYKVPKDFVFVPELPRNAMGKVNKPEVRKLFRHPA